MACPVIAAVLLIDISQIEEMCREEILVAYRQVGFLSIICLIEQIVLLQDIVHVCIESLIELGIRTGSACRLHQLRHALWLKSFYGHPEFEPSFLGRLILVKSDPYRTVCLAFTADSGRSYPRPVLIRRIQKLQFRSP